MFVAVGVIVLVVWRDDLFGGQSESVIEFHHRTIEGLPPYPGGTQVSGVLALEVPASIREYIGEDDALWVAYRTGDAVEDITFYYVREMELRGYAQVQSDVANAIQWRSPGRKYAVFIAVDRIQNFVILGTAPG